jgi:murein L,D-transpeptidase YcbB/YkuD
VYLVIRLIKIGVALTLLSAFSLAQAASVEFEAFGFTQQVKSSSAQKLVLDWSSILRLYAGLDGEALWHDGETLNQRGKGLLSKIVDAEADGLNPADYHLHRLRQLHKLSRAEARVLRELLLTDGYLRLAADLRQGNRAVRTRDPFWSAQVELFDPVGALLTALQQKRFHELLDNLSPLTADYNRLRQALAEYRLIERVGGWPRLAVDYSLRPGVRDPWIARLRERLALENGWSWYSMDDPDLYDSDLVVAVERFQSRHGLVTDGVVGPATLEALNVPVSRRIAQLRANLERWRWLPHHLEADHILVNTAGFQITLQTEGRVVFSGRTVNGRVERQTPPLISHITHLVANPQWTLPRRIAVQDMLPKQQEDPGYLSRKQIRVHQWVAGELRETDPQFIDWSLYNQDYFPFVLKQDAGPSNSLGRIKFHLPNRHDIYLHDTPAVGLFERSRRDLSSGCVRVEGAHRLARLLILRADPEDADRFNQAMETGETLWVPLAQPMPIYLTYFTSWVDAAGEVHFRPDIYRRDADLMLALVGDNDPLTADRLGYFRPAQL